MDQLGSMETDQLLRMLVTAIICAAVMFALIVSYYVLARRARKRLQAGSGEDVKIGDPNVKLGTSVPVQNPAIVESSERQSPYGSSSPMEPLDVQARLSGTGREMWLMGETAPTGRHKSTGAANEILRLERDLANGKVFVYIGELRYLNLSEIQNRAVGEIVLKAITCALRFSDGLVATDQGVKFVDLPSCGSVEIPPGFAPVRSDREGGVLLSLVNQPQSNSFSIVVSGSSFQNLRQVPDRKTGQRILEGITRLLQFSQGRLATDEGIGVLLTPPLSDEPFVLQQSVGNDNGFSRYEPAEAASSLTEEQEAFLSQLRQQVHLSNMERLTVERPSLLGSIRRMREKSESQESTFDLVSEIDRVFQEILAVSKFRDTDVELIGSEMGEVRIRVGTTFFDTIDKVPDEDLRRLIQRAVEEWQEK